MITLLETNRWRMTTVQAGRALEIGMRLNRDRLPLTHLALPQSRSLVLCLLLFVLVALLFGIDLPPLFNAVQQRDQHKQLSIPPDANCPHNPNPGRHGEVGRPCSISCITTHPPDLLVNCTIISCLLFHFAVSPTPTAQASWTPDQLHPYKEPKSGRRSFKPCRRCKPRYLVYTCSPFHTLFPLLVGALGLPTVGPPATPSSQHPPSSAKSSTHIIPAIRAAERSNVDSLPPPLSLRLLLPPLPPLTILAQF